MSKHILGIILVGVPVGWLMWVVITNWGDSEMRGIIYSHLIAFVIFIGICMLIS